MHEQVIGAFAAKAGEIIGAEKAVLYFLDSDKKLFWTFQKDMSDQLRELRISATSGVASAVVKTGNIMNVADVSTAANYDPSVDGAQSRTLLAAPVKDSRQAVFAVIELSNKSGSPAFTQNDEQLIAEFTDSLGVLMESWWRMGCICRSGTVGFSEISSCS